MNIIIWLIVGGILGWLASMMMKTDGQQGIILNVVVGIVGAMLGGWLLSPLLGAGTIPEQLQFAGVGGVVPRCGDPAGDRQSGAPRARALTVLSTTRRPAPR